MTPKFVILLLTYVQVVFSQSNANLKEDSQYADNETCFRIVAKNINKSGTSFVLNEISCPTTGPIELEGSVLEFNSTSLDIQIAEEVHGFIKKGAILKVKNVDGLPKSRFIRALQSYHFHLPHEPFIIDRKATDLQQQLNERGSLAGYQDPFPVEDYLRIFETRIIQTPAKKRPANSNQPFPGKTMVVDVSSSANTPSSQCFIDLSGDDGPTPPPNPNWVRPTPSSKICFKNKKKSQIHIAPFLRNPNQETEVIDIDSDDENSAPLSMFGETIDFNTQTSRIAPLFAPPTFVPCISREGNTLTVRGPLVALATRQPTKSSSSSSSGSSGISLVAYTKSDSEVSCDGDDRPRYQMALPLLRENPDDPGPLIPEEIDPARRWFGLLWGVPGSGTTNDCTWNSFLSHLVYLQRRYLGYFDRFCNLHSSQNDHEEFVKMMVYTVPAQRGTTTAYEWSRNVHRTLVEKVMPPNSVPRIGRDYNLATSGANIPGVLEAPELYTVFYNSGRFYIIYGCACGQRTLPGQKRKFTAQDIKHLDDMSNYPLTTEFDKNPKKCKSCKTKFAAARGMVSRATWFLRFPVIHTENVLNFPTTIRMRQIETNRWEYYDLGFFQYSSTTQQAGMNHVTSLHYVNGQLRYYDSMLNNGATIPLTADPSSLNANHWLQYVYYFRRFWLTEDGTQYHARRQDL